MQPFHSPYNTGPQACEALRDASGSRMSVFILASVLLHILALLTVAHGTRGAGGSPVARDEVIRVDLVSIPAASGPASAPLQAETLPRTPAVPNEAVEIPEPDDTQTEEIIAPTTTIETAPEPKEPAPASAATSPEKALPTTAPITEPLPAMEASPPPAAAASRPEATSHHNGGGAPAASAPKETATRAPAGSGTGAGSSPSPAQYVEESFYYIKDLITRNLSYPAVARRMKWQGTVVVSFVVCEDGFVENMAMVKSSGHSVLDKNVLATIDALQPFPAPPAAAAFNMPITYTLRR